ncbi:MAG: flagellar basal body L-ring protein FlgH [Candidatus Brocadiae bacterium]|nr:flagellar basal body L-ring protein FlgH [Candidatus Brocadiia bacterium]
MRNRTGSSVVVWLAALFALAAALPAANAESIWDRKKQDAAFLYSDNVAADVGDCITVLIADQSTFKLEGEREMEKKTSHSGSLYFESPIVDMEIPAGALRQQSSRKMEGSDEYTGNRQFSDSITVTVRDMLPNGNMVIAGRNERVIAGETVVTVLNGIVRPEDVSGANSISSRMVAHLNIRYETGGSSDAYIKEGIVNRILSYVWPF